MIYLVTLNWNSAQAWANEMDKPLNERGLRVVITNSMHSADQIRGKRFHPEEDALEFYGPYYEGLFWFPDIYEHMKAAGFPVEGALA